MKCEKRKNYTNKFIVRRRDFEEFNIKHDDNIGLKQHLISLFVMLITHEIKIVGESPDLFCI